MVQVLSCHVQSILAAALMMVAKEKLSEGTRQLLDSTLPAELAQAGPGPLLNTVAGSRQVAALVATAVTAGAVGSCQAAAAAGLSTFYQLGGVNPLLTTVAAAFN